MGKRWNVVAGMLALLCVVNLTAACILFRDELGGSANAAAWLGGIGSMLAAFAGIGAAGLAWLIAREQDATRRREAEIDRSAKAWLLASWLSPGILDLQTQARERSAAGKHSITTFYWLDVEVVGSLSQLKIRVSEDVHRGITDAHIFDAELPSILGHMLGSILLFNSYVDQIIIRTAEGGEGLELAQPMEAAADNAVQLAERALKKLTAYRAAQMLKHGNSER